MFDSYTQDQSKESKSSQLVHKNHGSDLSVTTLPARTQVPNWKPVKDAIVFSQRGGKLPSISVNSTLEESDEVQITNQTEHPGAKGLMFNFESFIFISTKSCRKVSFSYNLHLIHA